MASENLLKIFLSVSKIYSYVGMSPVLFDVLKIKQLIALNYDIKNKAFYYNFFHAET